MQCRLNVMSHNAHSMIEHLNQLCRVTKVCNIKYMFELVVFLVELLIMETIENAETIRKGNLDAINRISIESETAELSSISS